jgi:hypothetical protein
MERELNELTLPELEAARDAALARISKHAASGARPTLDLGNDMQLVDDINFELMDRSGS